MEKAKEAAVSDKAARQTGLGVHGMLLHVGLSSHSRNLGCSIDNLLSGSRASTPEPEAPMVKAKEATVSDEAASQTGLGVAGMLRRIGLWAKEEASRGRITITGRELLRWKRAADRSAALLSVSIWYCLTVLPMSPSIRAIAENISKEGAGQGYITITGRELLCWTRGAAD